MNKPYDPCEYCYEFHPMVWENCNRECTAKNEYDEIMEKDE